MTTFKENDEYWNFFKDAEMNVAGIIIEYIERNARPGRTRTRGQE